MSSRAKLCQIASIYSNSVVWLLAPAIQGMARVPATVVFVQSGEPGDTLKQLVHQICQDQCLLPPLLPLEYENIRYRLHHSASAGKTQYVFQSFTCYLMYDEFYTFQMPPPMATLCKHLSGRPTLQVLSLQHQPSLCFPRCSRQRLQWRRYGRVQIVEAKQQHTGYSLAS